MEATEPGPGCALSAGRGGMVTFHDRARYERFIGFRTEPRSHNWRENIEPLYRIRSSADNFPTNCAYGGADRKSLFIVESHSGSILRAEMPTAGRQMLSHK